MSSSAEIPTDTDPLAAMLADPEIRESLAVIAANAPTLAALSSMSTALLQRGPEIADNINGTILQLRADGGDAELADTWATVRELLPLLHSLAERKETIQGFLDSPILQPEIVDVVGKFGEAALIADEQTRGRQAEVGGVFSLVKQLKDVDVQETLAFLLTFSRVFGSRQRNG
ncbi:MAG: hypothetical protein RLZ55_1659 [Actinomycetota bacterium]|jgi:uncharacterized protein YjgD (DUF1641 family)